MPPTSAGRTFLTDPDAFRDVSRGNPKPFTLKGEALVKARLTPETWRLEIVSDGSTQLQKPRRLDDGQLFTPAWPFAAPPRKGALPALSPGRVDAPLLQ